MPTQGTVPVPFAQATDEAEPIVTPSGRVTVRILATGAQTGGVMGLMENVYLPGNGFPMHVHNKEDETLYVLEGTVLWVGGDLRTEAGPGTLIYGPRGIPHGFVAIGDVPLKFIEWFNPAGLEELFNAPEELARYIAAGRTSERYDLQVVGPLPE